MGMGQLIRECEKITEYKLQICTWSEQYNNKFASEIQSKLLPGH